MYVVTYLQTNDWLKILEIVVQKVEIQVLIILVDKGPFRVGIVSTQLINF